MERTTYAIALGSNRRGIHGAPAATIRAALAAVGGVVAVSPIIASAPLGPSIRRYANAGHVAAFSHGAMADIRAFLREKAAVDL